MTSTTLIEVRGLQRRDAKSGRRILDDVNLTIQAGEQIGLVGPSGSGKSSLLRAIAKLDRLHAGEVLFEGHEVTRDEIPAFRRQVIYLSQRPAMINATARTNLYLPFQLASASGGLDELQVVRWLEQLGQSSQLLDQPVEQLSGGEQQMIAVVRAIALSPRVLLLDEPTASLDAESTRRLEALIASWQQASGGDADLRRALVWTSHNVEQIERVSTRIVEMRDGKLVKGD